MFNEIKSIDNTYIMPTYGRIDVAIESGHGSIATDVDGKEYVDFTSGIGVNCLGYSNEKWAEAVSNQAKKVQHICNYYYSPVSTELAEKLSKLSGMSKMFFANSGCEANECAIKVARKFGESKGAYKIITLENSFHGRTITTLAANGQDAFHGDFLPLTEGFVYAEPNSIESLKALIDDKTCAVMLECVQGEGGVLPLDAEYLQAVRELCTEKGILMVVDEVQTGICRTGEFLSYQSAGILPDVVTLAKAIGGGLPIGICMVSEAYKDTLTAGMHGSTFGANPVSCAGALAVLEQVANEDFLSEVVKKGEYFKAKLEAMDGVDFVRGKGLMIGISLKEKSAKEMLLNTAKEGLLILTAKDLVRFLPPLNITYDEIDRGLAIFKKVLED